MLTYNKILTAIKRC